MYVSRLHRIGNYIAVITSVACVQTSLIFPQLLLHNNKVTLRYCWCGRILLVEYDICADGYTPVQRGGATKQNETFLIVILLALSLDFELLHGFFHPDGQSRGKYIINIQLKCRLCVERRVFRKIFVFHRRNFRTCISIKMESVYFR